MSALFFILFFFLLATPAYALNNADPAMIGNLNGVFASALRSLITLVGFATLAMLVYGGFKFLAAGSDKEGAQKAQKTITYAVAGLIITLSSYIILNLFGLFLGVDLGVFNICITPNCA